MKRACIKNSILGWIVFILSILSAIIVSFLIVIAIVDKKLSATENVITDPIFIEELMWALLISCQIFLITEVVRTNILVPKIESMLEEIDLENVEQNSDEDLLIRHVVKIELSVTSACKILSDSMIAGYIPLIYFMINKPLDIASKIIYPIIFTSTVVISLSIRKIRKELE